MKNEATKVLPSPPAERPGAEKDASHPRKFSRGGERTMMVYQHFFTDFRLKFGGWGGGALKPKHFSLSCQFHPSDSNYTSFPVNKDSQVNREKDECSEL